MRKAKVICTLGPASDAPGVLEGMIRAGMDVARFNFSHGTHQDHRRRMQLLRKIARKEGRVVAVLQDIQGPKIRVGAFDGGQAMLRAGETITVTTRKVVGNAQRVPTPIQSLPRDVRKGHPILLDDGRIRLEVLGVRGRDITARVLVGGIIRDRKGLNLPGAAMSVPTITEKDVADLAFGQQLGVDYVALSFVRSPDDVRLARAHVAKLKTPLIAKIEKPQAVDRLEEIAAVSDGVMVARGDLGVEMALEKLPGIQKRAIQLVNRMGGIVIVATEMLESMVTSSRPTRAEVSDVANAVLDGADAVMLSGETASGQHPVAAVETMARIVLETERTGTLRLHHTIPFEHQTDVSTGVAAAAVAASAQMKGEFLVAYTESGNTARLISEFRPHAQILGLTPNAATTRRMALYWGVLPMQVGRLQSTDAMVRQVKRLCAEKKLCHRGKQVVIVAGVPLNTPGKTNTMSIHTV
jgi:pyruvate kinase